MKVLGIILHPCLKTLINLNWEEQFQKFNRKLFSWESRNLTSLFERAEVLKTFALSTIWFRAQLLPLPDTWAKKFEGAMSRFLWKGFQFRNLLSLETVCQPLDSGGLGIPHLRSKCDNLLLKQTLRMIVTSRNSFNHITFWLGSVLKIPGLTDFILLQQTGEAERKNSPNQFFHICLNCSPKL